MRSGRGGRDPRADDPVRGAVVAYIRHVKTEYDQLIEGLGKDAARAAVKPMVMAILTAWEKPRGRSVSR